MVKVKYVNQTRNGVRVSKYMWPDGGSTVTSRCLCFGFDFRSHDDMTCPVFLRQQGRAANG